MGKTPSKEAERFDESSGSTPIPRSRSTNQKQLGLENVPRRPLKKDLKCLEGTVARVVYYNDESGFTVLVFEGAHGEADGPKVVGVLPGLQEGATVKVWGRWETKSKHGPQFTAERFVEVSPQTRQGILRYLSSGMVEGIGKGMAGRIVDEFGEETLEIIENQPDRLTEIPGIGRKRSQKIKETFGQKKALSRTLVFLRGHGLNASQSQRVYKKYGVDTVNEVTRNPYNLIRDISGVGFLTADRIAQSVGIALDAPQRVEAGLIHTLYEASDSGHCYLPKDELLKGAEKKLGVEEGHLHRGLAAILERGWAVGESANEGGGPERGGGLSRGQGAAPKPNEHVANVEIVYPVRLYRAESGVAKGLTRLLSRRSLPLPFDEEKNLPALEKELCLQLSATQRKALALAMREKVVVITGGPGTGKTTLVRGLLRLFEKRNLDVALAAPTGRAARRMKELTGQDAKTIHRLLEYTPHLHRFSRDEDNPLDTEVIIVDEVSMVDISLAHDLLKAMDDATRLILVGDVDQLPSVGPGSVLTDIIRSEAVPTVRLVDIFRQAQESQIVMAAHQVNSGQMIEVGPRSSAPRTPRAGAGSTESGGPGEATDAKDRGKGRLFVIQKSDAAAVVDLICKMTAERIPQRFRLDPLEDVQILCPMKNGVLGTGNLNNRLRRLLNPSAAEAHDDHTKRPALRPGDKVMQIVNNYDKEVFNGDIGRVISQDPRAGKLLVQFEDRQALYERSEQSQLQLSYACTIHKSQGSEYPAVIVPLHTKHFIMLQRNLLYTAITRAKELCVLIGEQRAIWTAIRNASIRRRYTRLHRRLQDLRLRGRGGSR